MGIERQLKPPESSSPCAHQHTCMQRRLSLSLARLLLLSVCLGASASLVVVEVGGVLMGADTNACQYFSAILASLQFH